MDNRTGDRLLKWFRRRRTLRAYSSYWKQTVEQWGDRRLDEPTPSGIKQLVASVEANAVQRRSSRGGGHAAENLISALRCLYNHAVDDGLIAEKDNPARKVAKPAACRPPARISAEKLRSGQDSSNACITPDLR